MEALSPSINFSITSPIRPHKSFTHSSSSLPFKFTNSTTNKNHLNFSSSSFTSCVSSSSTKTRATSTSAPHPSLSSPSISTHHWMVLMEGPPQGPNSKPEVTSYYVRTLERVLGSERDAQKRIYDVSLDAPFGFCCDIDEEASPKLSGLPGVLSVKPDPDVSSTKKDYSSSRTQPTSLPHLQTGSTLLFPAGNTKGWLVRMDKPGVGVVMKAQMVDFYSQILTIVLQNEQDAQMCIYNVSWQSNFGFCCELDEECAKELAGGKNSIDQPDSSEASQKTPIKSKKLFVTGLSFYTSEKTLRAAFEGFGELVGVKIIMDKISRRSKGYAFVEYTTEEAASAALKEMTGKIINGWMIVVDFAKTTPQKHDRSRSGPAA